MRRFYKRHYQLIIGVNSLILCAFLLLVCIFGGSLSAFSAYADTDYVTAFEDQNVIDDLEGSTIAGVEFDLANYPYDENGEPQVINFVEFAYSFYSENQDDYNLYVYVYNPQGYAFKDTTYNKIQFSYDGGKTYIKPSLEIVNYCNKSGYEGLFYKFKVTLTDSMRTSLLSTLNSSSRVYRLSGIELCVNGNLPVEYEVTTEYTYTGYSLGYGSSAATESSLSCNVVGFDRYINLDVTHTTYRAEGDYYNGEQSQLDSVYFTVPNEYFESYGELTNIACEWYEYVTKPMLVTEDVNIYNAMNSLYGRSLDNVSGSYDYLFLTYGYTDSSWFDKSANMQHASNLTFEDGESYSWYSGINYNTVTFGTADFGNFGGVFYTGGESYDGYSVAGEDILAKLRSYSTKLGDTSICGKYAASLFDSGYAGAGYSGIVDVDIEDTNTLYKYDTTKAWYQYIVGGYTAYKDVFADYNAILTFSDYDVFSNYEGVHFSYDKLSDYDTSAITDTFFIGEADVDDFLTTCKKAKANDETVVLMRFASSTYISQPCAQARNSSSDSDSKTTLVKDCFSQWYNSDYSAYVFQETVYLNFDIISLTFTLDDVATVIPVVMSPVDLAGDSSSPNYGTYSNTGCSSGIWSTVLTVLLVLLLFILFAPILPYILQGVVWVVCLPFKLIGSLFKHKNE